MSREYFCTWREFNDPARINQWCFDDAGTRDGLIPLMAQLFPTKERSFLLPRLTSNCVHVVAVSSSRPGTFGAFMLPSDCCRSSRRCIRAYTQMTVKEGAASFFTTVAPLYYDVTTCRSFLMRRSVYCSVRDFDSNVTFSSRMTWKRPSTCECIYVCVYDQPRASYQRTRCNKSRTSSHHQLFITLVQSSVHEKNRASLS